MEGQGRRINNAFYEELGEGWYEDSAHPIALLRAENAARNPWILERINTVRGPKKDILDIGCGAGFLTNSLALGGHHVTGIDQSAKSLSVARKRDATQSVCYLQLDAFSLPFPDKSFDVITAMDFLEHVEEPEKMIREVARLLRPGGLFFFHTFNRNLWSYLLIIKGVEWLVPNTPQNMHVYPLFIKPVELKAWCETSGLAVQEMHGLSLQLASRAFWRSFVSRRVDQNIAFKFSRSLLSGYIGFAEVI